MLRALGPVQAWPRLWPRCVVGTPGFGYGARLRRPSRGIEELLHDQAAAESLIHHPAVKARSGHHPNIPELLAACPSFRHRGWSLHCNAVAFATLSLRETIARVRAVDMLVCMNGGDCIHAMHLRAGRTLVEAVNRGFEDNPDVGWRDLFRQRVEPTLRFKRIVVGALHAGGGRGGAFYPMSRSEPRALGGRGIRTTTSAGRVLAAWCDPSSTRTPAVCEWTAGTYNDAHVHVHAENMLQSKHNIIGTFCVSRVSDQVFVIQSRAKSTESELFVFVLRISRMPAANAN